jgi:membrane-bound ClpP family serine protease
MGLIIALIILGLVLLLAEILLIPGVGFAGILGLVSMGGSCYLAFADYGTSTGLVVLSVIVVVLIILLIWVLRAKTWEKMALKTNITAKAGLPEVSVSTGDRGQSVTRLAPMGNARFGDEVLEVSSMSGIINSGEEIEVVMIEDCKIYVKSCK